MNDVSTFKGLIKLMHGKLGGDRVSIFFRTPNIYLVGLVENDLDLSIYQSKRHFLAHTLDISLEKLELILANSLTTLEIYSIQEFNELKNHDYMNSYGINWLQALSSRASGSKLSDDPMGQYAEFRSQVTNAKAPRVLHFYGYKGGQARSTVLGSLSRVLAESGWRVLVVDSDIEAPSLDRLYGSGTDSIQGTLLGLVNAPDINGIRPTRTIHSTERGGYVEAIFCCPQPVEDYDIELAALSSLTALDPDMIVDIGHRVWEFAQSEAYDVIMIDHRSGISPITLPWVVGLPGTVVVCNRLDSQWRAAKEFYKVLLSANQDIDLQTLGIFVSFKADDEQPEAYEERTSPERDELLMILAEIIYERLQISDDYSSEFSSEELSIEEVLEDRKSDSWVMWPHDSVFRGGGLPDKFPSGSIISEALNKLRGILGLVGTKNHAVERNLTPSGANDEGIFIETEALRELTSENSKVLYILGRKGTGKTRLLRELARPDLPLGKPLFVDPQYAKDYHSGLCQTDNEVDLGVTHYQRDPINFWWHLLAAALECGNTHSDELRVAFAKEQELPPEDKPFERIQQLLQGLSKPVTYLIDGIETGIRPQQLPDYVEALFRFLQAIDLNPKYSEKLKIKLFIRSDLVSSIQNIEQQLSGKTLDLVWNQEKIYNFMLSRIASIPWYEEKFSDVVKSINSEEMMSRIRKGVLSIQDSEDILLQIFPEKLPRKSMYTMTFIKIYFSDNTDTKSTALNYYPRMIDQFLRYIANDDKKSRQQPRSHKYVDHPIEEGRVSGKLVFSAHEDAADDYFEQVKQELIYYLDLNDDPSSNKARVEEFINSFRGERSPFEVELLTQRIANKLKDIDRQKIAQALNQLLKIGIFEVVPRETSKWRVGRLYKTALGMKYGSKNAS